MSLSKNSKISKQNAADISQLCAEKFACFQQNIADYLVAEIPDWQPKASEVAQIGSSRLLDYGGEGEVVLILPPLINRASILESFAVGLTKNARVFMVDWSDPSGAEEGFDSADYALRVARFEEVIGRPLHLLGYCMGGIIALKAAQNLAVKSIMLVATPWSFAYLKQPAQEIAQTASQIPSERIPSEILQSLFFKLDPLRVFDKFSKLAAKPEAKKAEFFAIEKWVNDGVPMAKGLFVEAVERWIGQDEKDIVESDINAPIFAACPMQDKIVPLKSSTAIARDFPDCKIQKYETGHIGLVIKGILYNDIFSWINELR